MGFDDALTHRKSDAHSSGRVVGEPGGQGTARLHRLTHLRGDALSPVPHLHHRPVILAEQVQADVVVVAGVADGVFQQVDDDLLDEKRVILVIEDEKTISNFICRALNANDYKPIPAFRGKEGMSLFYSHSPDLVLLDLGLPDMDGMDILKELSALPQETPVIIISARDRESEKVRALDMGADDYIVKPFGVSELLARIRTTLRRSDRLRMSQGTQKDIYHIKDLTVNIPKHQVLLNGEEIHFTQNEFKILELLCIHAGKVLTYDFILEHVWGPYGGTSNQILRVNMANIRRKLKENPSAPKYIYTELGIGYRMLED